MDGSLTRACIVPMAYPTGHACLEDSHIVYVLPPSHLGACSEISIGKTMRELRAGDDGFIDQKQKAARHSHHADGERGFQKLKTPKRCTTPCGNKLEQRFAVVRAQAPEDFPEELHRTAFGCIATRVHRMSSQLGWIDSLCLSSCQEGVQLRGAEPLQPLSWNHLRNTTKIVTYSHADWNNLIHPRMRYGDNSPGLAKISLNVPQSEASWKESLNLTPLKIGVLEDLIRPSLHACDTGGCMWMNIMIQS